MQCQALVKIAPIDCCWTMSSERNCPHSEKCFLFPEHFTECFHRRAAEAAEGICMLDVLEAKR